MNSEENNQEGNSDPENTEGEGTEESISVKKADYDKLNETLGSLKRENKDFKKEIENLKNPKETLKTKPEELTKLQSQVETLGLKSLGLTTEKEIELAKKIQKETGMDWSKLSDSKYFLHELDELRTQEKNLVATTEVRGGGGESNARNTPEFWLALGRPPNKEESAKMDRKDKAKILRAFMKEAEGVGKNPYYNG